MTFLKSLGAAVLVATASMGMANAAPVVPAAAQLAVAAHNSIDFVYWVRRHGHKVWVQPRRHR